MVIIKNSFKIFILCMISTMCFSSSDTNLKKSDHYISANSLVVLLKNYLKSKGIDSYPSIDKNKKFKNCEKDIQFFPLFKSWSTVEVVCSNPNNNWKIYVRTRANNSYQDNNNEKKLKQNLVIIANKSLQKGHVISKNDLKLIEIDKSIGTGIFNSFDDLIGRKLKQNVSLGFPIRSRHLKLDWVISKGDKIDIIQKINTVFISASGIALENGQKGEKIKVMNLSSEKNLVAWVLNERKVSIQTKINSN